MIRETTWEFEMEPHYLGAMASAGGAGWVLVPIVAGLLLVGTLIVAALWFGIPWLIRALKNPRVRNWFLYELGWLFLISTFVVGVTVAFLPLGWHTLLLTIVMIGLSLAGVFMVEKAKPGIIVSRL
jgi:hypothetical protein